MPQYFFLNDLNIVAKKQEHVPYIFVKGQGWVVDNDNILMDRVMGYGGEEIGCIDMLLRVEEITEEEVLRKL